MKEADIVPEKISHLDDVTDQQSLEQEVTSAPEPEGQHWKWINQKWTKK